MNRIGNENKEMNMNKDNNGNQNKKINVNNNNNTGNNNNKNINKNNNLPSKFMFRYFKCKEIKDDT